MEAGSNQPERSIRYTTSHDPGHRVRQLADIAEWWQAAVDSEDLTFTLEAVLIHKDEDMPRRVGWGRVIAPACQTVPSQIAHMAIVELVQDAIQAVLRDDAAGILGVCSDCIMELQEQPLAAQIYGKACRALMESLEDGRSGEDVHVPREHRAHLGRPPFCATEGGDADGR